MIIKTTIFSIILLFIASGSFEVVVEVVFMAVEICCVINSGHYQKNNYRCNGSGKACHHGYPVAYPVSLGKNPAKTVEGCIA